MRLLKVGRNSACDIILRSERVSNFHAEITLLNNGDLFLVDTNSTNGTFVMGKRIAPGNSVSIQRGDAVRFADTELDWNQVPKVVTPQGLVKIKGIGSNMNNEIVLSEKTVSRFHATLMYFNNGKVYLEDHSKNGTIVNGEKINYGKQVEVKKGDKTSFGGVEYDLGSHLPEPKGKILKRILIAIAAAAVIVASIWLLKDCKGISQERTDEWIFNRYQNATAIVIGGFHYEVSAGQLDIDKLNRALRQANMPTIPTRVIRDETGELVQSTNGITRYTGTGFFVSDNGKLVTNLHVANPWMADFDTDGDLVSASIEQVVRSLLTQNANYLLQHGINANIASYLPMVKCEGKLDFIGIVPNGQFFDEENMVKCRVVDADRQNLTVDLALLTTVDGNLPKGASFVNVTDSLGSTDEDWTVASHIYTIGFPAGLNTQNVSKSQVATLGHGGNITQNRDNFSFGFDAASTHGSSGSPIFNKYGYLIGVVSSGINGSTALNYGIKGNYIKDLIEKNR